SNIPHESRRIYAVRGYRWLSCAESPHLVDTDNFLSFIACIILVSVSVSENYQLAVTKNENTFMAA
ncbi:hypothetical protein, partial [Klebsiella oxytoca]